MSLRQGPDQMATRIDERIRCRDQAATGLARERRDSGFDFCLVAHRGCRKLDRERCRGCSEFTQEDRIERRAVGIEQQRHTCDVGGNLLEHLQPFPDQGKVNEGEARDIAAGIRQGRHEALSNRIVNDVENDRDGVGRPLQCGNNRRPAADDEVRCRTHQLCCLCLDLTQISTGVSMLDSDIAVLSPAERLETLAKCNDPSQHLGIVLGVWMQECDAPHALALLRARCKRAGCRRAAD